MHNGVFVWNQNIKMRLILFEFAWNTIRLYSKLANKLKQDCELYIKECNCSHFLRKHKKNGKKMLKQLNWLNDSCFPRNYSMWYKEYHGHFNPLGYPFP